MTRQSRRSICGRRSGIPRLAKEPVSTLTFTTQIPTTRHRVPSTPTTSTTPLPTPTTPLYRSRTPQHALQPTLQHSLMRRHRLSVTITCLHLLRDIIHARPSRMALHLLLWKLLRRVMRTTGNTRRAFRTSLELSSRWAGVRRHRRPIRHLRLLTPSTNELFIRTRLRWFRKCSCSRRRV